MNTYPTAGQMNGWIVAAVGPCVYLGTEIQDGEVALVVRDEDGEIADAVIKQKSELANWYAAL